jgi:hypothetical protein
MHSKRLLRAKKRWKNLRKRIFHWIKANNGNI